MSEGSLKKLRRFYSVKYIKMREALDLLELSSNRSPLARN
jgi:hypothetical protein